MINTVPMPSAKRDNDDCSRGIVFQSNIIPPELPVVLCHIAPVSGMRVDRTLHNQISINLSAEIERFRENPHFSLGLEA